MMMRCRVLLIDHDVISLSLSVSVVNQSNTCARGRMRWEKKKQITQLLIIARAI